MRDIPDIIIARPEAEVELGVIGMAVDLRRVTFNDLKEERGVNNEQQWTQAGTLGNTAAQRKFHQLRLVDSDQTGTSGTSHALYPASQQPRSGDLARWN